jgi:hypothetical protein
MRSEQTAQGTKGAQPSAYQVRARVRVRARIRVRIRVRVG